MFNKVVMVGNLTRDVELRYLPSGVALATIGLASNRRYKKQDGSVADEVCFIDVKLFGRVAEIANQYLRKGSRVLIEGKLSYETWTDQNGTKRSRHTISAENMSMLDSKSALENTGESGGYYQNHEPHAVAPKSPAPSPQGDHYANNVPEIDIDDNEIPF